MQGAAALVKPQLGVSAAEQMASDDLLPQILLWLLEDLNHFVLMEMPVTRSQVQP